MDSTVEAADPSLNDASAELDRLMADELASGQPAGGQAAAGSAGQTAQSAAPAAETPSQTSKTGAKPDGTPATTEVSAKDKPGEPGSTSSATKPATETKEPSKFEKAAARQKTAWEQINTEKADVRAERERLKAEREQFTNDRKALDQAKAKANAPKYQPGDYDEAASGWEREAQALEEQGKFDEADEKRVLSRKAKERAKDLREHPPQPDPTDAQKEAKFREEQKQWWSKAAIDFPEVAKDGTPASAALKELIRSEPHIMGDPKAMYFASRMAQAETVAASVPGMAKELEALRAKVKDLEGKLEIPTEGAAHQLGELSFAQKSEAEQEAELYAMAQDVRF